MKKTTIELYRQKDCWKNWGFVPWLEQDLKKKGIDISVETALLKFSQENNAFIYRHSRGERFEEYVPTRYFHDEKNRCDYTLGDGIIYLDVFYYDKSEVPPEYTALLKIKEELKEAGVLD